MLKSINELTTSGIFKPSPVQVLTGAKDAWLASSGGVAYFQRGMTVDNGFVFGLYFFPASYDFNAFQKQGWNWDHASPTFRFFPQYKK